MEKTSGHSLLAAYPPEVTFEGVEFGPLYVMQVNVQNTSSRVQRVRVVPPSSEYFNLNYTPEGSVAPGLDVMFEVEFQATQERDYHDAVTVTCGNETLKIPVHALVAAPKVEFNGLVNLGTVVRDSSVAKYVTFKNTGHRESKVTITIDEGLPVTITPMTFSLGSKGAFEDLDGDGRMEQDEFVDAAESVTSKRVRVELTHGTIERFHAIAKVTMTGGQPDRYLDINADVVDQRLELSFPEGGGSADIVPFGSIFFGARRVIKAYLVNNGPQTSGFSISFPSFKDKIESGEDIDPVNDPLGLLGGEPEIKVEPMEGMIQPYAKLPVTFTFRPRDPDANAGFRMDAFKKGPRKPRPYDVLADIECSDTGQVLNVRLKGGGIAPEININETHINFGECAVNDRVDVLATIQNYGSELPCQFRVTKAAHFSVRPPAGRLMPGQSQDLVFSFRPAQMGRFLNTLQIVIGAGLLSLPVLVEGISNSILKSTTRATATGTSHGSINSMAYSRTKPKFKFVSAKDRFSSTQGSRSKFNRVPAWDPSKTDIKMFNMTIDPNSTYSIDEMVRVSAHKETYKDFIRTSHKKRVAARTIRDAKRYGEGYTLPKVISVENPGVDLGIAPRSGMSSPLPPIPTMNDELYLKTPLGNTGRSKNKGPTTREEQVHDPNRLFKKKYKSKPTVQAELRDCAATLSSNDLLCISAGPKVLDFGRITVKSTVVKCFSVVNDLPANVLIECDFEAAEINKSFPASQVVPGGSTAGFDIVLNCEHVQSLKHTVMYKVNGVHSLKFIITAEVVPITLDLGADQLMFEFADDSLEKSTTVELEITNPGNASCNFRWASRRGSAYDVFPSKGTVAANSSTSVSVTFSPSAGLNFEEDLKMHVVDGAPKILKCIGIVAPAKCVFKTKMLEFGTVSVGQRSEERAVIKNVSGQPAVFYATTGDAHGASVLPTQGLIHPGKSTEFTVALAPRQAHQYNPDTDKLRVEVRGMGMVTLPMECRAALPRVFVLEDQFDFGDVAIGASVKLPLTLVNEGNIAAHIVIDLTAHPDFSIQRMISADGDDDRPQTARSILVPIQDETEKNNHVTTLGNDVLVPPCITRYKATVLGSSPLSLSFIFTPSGKAREYTFELPLALENVEDTPSLRRAVLAESKNPRIRLSSTSVDFDEVTISRDQMKRVPHHMTLIITNEDNAALEWECDTRAIVEAGLEGIIELDPPKGSLDMESITKVKVTFTPQGPDSYSVTIPIYLDGNHERPYLELTVSGSGVYPRLLFEVEEFVLPPVPLGEVARGLFYIDNQGYEDLNLRFRLPADRTRMPLQLEFPEGKTVGLAKKRLPVVASFVSARPLAFTSRVDFLDDDENRYSILITGITDNSILTVHSFLSNYSDQHEYTQTMLNGAVTFTAKKMLDMVDSAKLNKTSSKSVKGSRSKRVQRKARLSKRNEKLSAQRKKKEAKTEDGQIEVSWTAAGGDTMYATLPDMGLSSEQHTFFLKWLNCNLMPSDSQIVSFPMDLTERHGTTIVQLLESLMRKTLRGKLNPQRAPKHKSELVAALLRQWKSFITTLTTLGALLHHVHPEILLPRDLYLRHCLHTGPGAVALGDRTSLAALQRSRYLEQRFTQKAPRAWAIVLFQIVRVFLIGRVDARQYLSVPLVQMAEQQISQVDSRSAKAVTQGRRQKGNSSAGKMLETRLASLPEICHGNAHSESENLMLRWLNVTHVASGVELGVVPENMRRAFSIKDIADGVLLCSTLRAYVPSLGHKGGPLEVINFGSRDFVDNDTPNIEEKVQGGTQRDEAKEAKGEGNNKSMHSAGYRRQREPLTEEEAAQNVDKLCKALRQLDFVFVPDEADILRGGELEMLLLLTTVFNQLPQYYPKTEIEFAGELGQSVQKALALRNPTTRTLTYTSTLLGDSNFKFQGSNLVSVDAGTAVDCNLSFTSRFSTQAKARLELKSSREDGLLRSLLVFDLVSHVLGRQPQQTITARTCQYNPQTIKVQFTNPFDEACKFHVNLEQPASPNILVGDPSISSRHRSNRSNSNNASMSAANQQGAIANVCFPSSFALAASSTSKVDGDVILEVEGGATATVEVFFVAFQAQRHVAELVFLDPNVGEFMYSLVVDVDPPEVEDKIIKSTVFRPSLQVHLSLQTASKRFKVAQTALLDFLQKSQRQSQYKTSLSMLEAIQAVPRHFVVDISSPFYKGSSEVHLQAPGNADAPSLNGSNVEPATNFDLVLQPKDDGKYPCNVVLRSAIETRVYEVQLEVTSEGPERVLEFTTHARQAITQDIPIVNGTDTTWAIRATLKGSSEFSGPPILKIPAMSTGHYKLVYKPAWIGSEKASLVLSTSDGKYSFTYVLVGEAKDPLAMDHIKLECKARDKLLHEFVVPNASSRAISYEVESDLPQISGDSVLVVPPNSEKAYALAVTPPVGGTYSGSVTFRDTATGQYMWYTVEIHAESPQAEDELEVYAQTRKAVSIEISLGNPLPENVVFEVAMRGDGLIGDANFSLAAGDTDATYELIYSPLVAGTFHGSVTFTNEKLGEFWYKLVLVAQPAPPTELEPMCCGVGSSCTQEITIDNPTDSSLTLVSHTSNMTNYRIEPARITIPPYASRTAVVFYIPSSIDKEEPCVITLSHRRVGDIVYHVIGTGSLPELLTPQHVLSALHQGKSASFQFRNPFDKALHVQLSLVQDETTSHCGDYRLLARHAEVEIAPFAQLHIPFLFIPRIIGECRATLSVEASAPLSAIGERSTFSMDGNTKLRWVLPIEGETEVNVSDVHLSYICRARETLSQTLSMKVPGFENIPDLEADGFTHFSFELVIPEENKTKIEKALTIDFVKDTVAHSSSSVNGDHKSDTLQFALLFQPLIMFSEIIELRVRKDTGGVWRYPLKLQVTEPEVDDQITIEAKLHHTSSVSFDLTNVEPAPAQFKAYFSADSPVEFNVFPQKGELAPYGSREGTSFVLSFTPQDYGKTAVGKLIVQTEEMMWSYEVRGRLPQYIKPTLATSVSKIDSGRGQSRSQVRSKSKSRRR